MNKVFFLISLLAPFALYGSEVENTAQNKIVTSLTRTINADGTSERILTTIDAKGQFVKTIVKFAKDRTTIIHHAISTTDTIPLKDLLLLISTQNTHHVHLSIGGLKKLPRNNELNELAVQNYVELVGSIQSYVELVGSIQSNDIGTRSRLQKATVNL